MKATLVAMSLLSFSVLAILPVPYPTEPWEEEQPLWTVRRDPKNIAAFAELYSGGQAREMELPKFENAPDTLGYKADETFTIPSDLRPRVEFWKKIYSQYTSSEAVLHDADYPEIIYQVVDIGHIISDKALSYRKQMKIVNKLLKGEKEKIVRRLLDLHARRADPSSIPLEDFSTFKQFESIRDEDKFLLATQRIRAQIGQRDRVVQGFFYGGRYFHKMMEIFKSKKLPVELTRLPLVESAFNLQARSRVGASGVWQFMRSTGKKYLRIDRMVDERNDPLTATRAAADLLRQNFEALGSWPLAITAYNHGREGVAKAMRVLATESLSHIIKQYKSRTFGFASSNFYSEFLAMIDLEKEYRSHFGKLMVDTPIRFVEFTVNADARFEELALACAVTEQELATLNPALTDWVVGGRGPVPRSFILKVPENKFDRCLSGARNVSRLPKRGNSF
ncbi:MAG: lytic transglycosylase domain-containing protein [Deltaproteobacteria bacterium]|nr:lytic transglycosylase domain-containing protein [Deltaproteobacteria bacterium]